MCAKVAGKSRHQQRSSPHNVVAHKRHQHRMLDIMIESVAIADAVKRKPGRGRNEFGQTRLRRTKSTVHMIGEVGPQRLSR